MRSGWRKDLRAKTSQVSLRVWRTTVAPALAGSNELFLGTRFAAWPSCVERRYQLSVCAKEVGTAIFRRR